MPYLASDHAFLREAALRTVVFHFHLPAYKADAIRLLKGDPDEGVRQTAAMGLRVFAHTDRELLRQLLDVTLDDREHESVREAAFIAALVAAGLKRVPERVAQRAGVAPAPEPRPPLTGEEAKAFTDEVHARARKKHAELLTAAKADAARRGKEPFDLAKLETMCDTTHAGRLDPVETRHAEFERMYYVWHPEVMTLAEFAEKVHVWNNW